jgi:hypothetical protein
MPADPLGEIKIIKRLETINTVGNCRDLDVDIDDDILVAAANYNGYFVYKINYDTEGTISTLMESVHMSSDSLDTDLGDNRIESIVLSKANDIAFILDKYENIWLYKYGLGAEQYGGGEAKNMRIINTACLNYGGAWLSVAIDDKSDSIGVYFLLNHHSAELQPYCISEEDDNYVKLREWDDCLNIQNYFIHGFATQEDCEYNGHVWKDPGCKSGGEYAQYSTSLVWKKLIDVGPEDTAFEGEPDCEYIINQGTIAEKIFFNEGLLSMTYGELGVRNFKQSDENLCVVENLIDGETVYTHYDEDDMDGFCGDNFSNHLTCCKTGGCPPGSDGIPDSEGHCSDDNMYIELFGYPGLGGVYSSKGGIIPHIYSEFDTPGEVETIYSIDQTIFTGLSHSNGCMIAKLDDDGLIQFASGYTIKGIHQDGGLLALAAGNDGILLYNWNGGVDVSFIGKIETSYANNVKVAGDIIFAATEDGIEVIQIDR